MKKSALPIILILLLILSACTAGGYGENDLQAAASTAAQTTVPSAEEISAKLNDSRINADFLNYCKVQCGDELMTKLSSAAEQGSFDDSFWLDSTGATLNVLLDRFSGGNKAENYVELGGNDKQNFTISFVGDVNLADNWSLMRTCSKSPDGAASFVSKEVRNEMKSADVMIVNNEFSFSDRGAPLEGKMYTFRAKPENAEILKLLGVDAVCLANNHVYDYGKNAFYDTLSTLDSAGVKRFGAGKNANEAQQPLYYVINGIKVAIIGATRAEKYIMTPQAGENSPGVFRVYDDTELIKTIEQTKAHSDIVLVMLHWGTENTRKLEPVQVNLGQKCIDAGADVIIGAHPHCLQGMTSYKGKLIAYSLGNFWFNDEPADTGILKLTVSSPEKIDADFIPCRQQDCRTFMLNDNSGKQRVLSLMRNLSANLSIDSDGGIDF